MRPTASDRRASSAGVPGAPTDAPRLDVALHLLRLFKSRSQATAAIQRGDVLLNGAAVKPSHPLAAGDRVVLTSEGSRRTFEVLDLPRRALSKDAARALVREI